MIIAQAKADDGRMILILGLTDHNVRGMKAGLPVRLQKETHGEGVPEGWIISIFHGATEIDIYRQFVREGLIGEETLVKVDPRLGINTSENEQSAQS